MKRITFAILLLLTVLLPSCVSNKPKTPKTLKGYVLDFFINESYEKDSPDKKTYYFYRFLEDDHYDVETNNDDEDEKTGTYTYKAIGSQKAKLAFEYESKESDEKMRYEYILKFDSNKSGSWYSPKSKADPGEQRGTFVILKVGEE